MTIEEYEAQALKFLDEAEENGVLAVDTETTGLEVRDGTDHVTGLSLAFRRNGLYFKHYFPFRHIDENYGPGTLARVKDVIEGAKILVFHNAKFDLESLRTIGIYCDKENWYCTQIIASLINENFPFAKNLENCSKHYLGPEFGKAMSPVLKGVIDAFGWKNVPAAMMREYGEMDAELPLRLMEKFWPQFGVEFPVEVWDWKRKFVNVVRVMERRGVLIDKEYVKRKLEEAEIALDDYRDMVGGYNPGSPKQMNELLCVQLGLPPIYKENVRKNKETGKTEKYVSQTFNKDAMDEYEILLERLDSPLAEYILAYRGWSKAATSFYRAYLEHVSPDGRVRPRYHHAKDADSGGTVTGRLSCSEPNLQQIPKSSDKPWNGGVKRSFVAQEGYSLWEIDYKQLELRLGTAYAREESLKQVFAEDRDIFDEMALELGFPRQQTKTFVYMTQYGAGIPRIARIMGVTETRAHALKDAYYSTYRGFRRISETVKSQVKRARKVRLWSGRYRHFRNPKEDQHKAFNSLIQGGSADIVERSMVRVFEEVDQRSNDEVRMLLTVHDSVWFEIKNGTEDKWLPQIMKIMSDVGALGDFYDVQFDVDCEKLSEDA